MSKAVWSHPVFGQARWLWKGDPSLDERDRRMQFRRVFTLETVPERAEIAITADSAYQFYANGQYVHRGPARGFQKSWPFDRIDLAPYLRPGRNLLAVQVYQPGVSNFGYIYCGNAGLIAAGKIGVIDISTGGAWKGRVAPGFTRAVARLSQQLGWQEHYDARHEPTGNWKTLDYNDSDWLTRATLSQGRTAGALPWHTFEERDIPLLTSDLITPRKIVSKAVWQSTAAFRDPQNLTDLFTAERKNWDSTDGPADEITFAPHDDSTASGIILDFGTEVVGTPIVETDNASEGEILDLLCCESLSGASPDILPTQKAGSFAAFSNRMILAEGASRHEFTTVWGFRYFVLVRRGRGAQTLNVKIRLRQTIYPLEETGAFTSSDEMLNSIWEASRRTVRSCMLDAFVDCPWREQAQWWGDAVVIARNSSFLSPDARLLARGIRILGSQPLPNGLTPAHAPSGNPLPIVDFSLAWVVSHWNYYFQTGDLALFTDLRTRVREVLAYFHHAPSDHGLLYHDPRYWLFLDWCRHLHKSGASAVLNLQYLWALETVARLFALSGDKADADLYRNRATDLRRNIVDRLYDPATRKLSDGLTWSGERVPTTAPHTAALAILLDVLPNENATLARDILLPALEGDWRKPDASDANGYVRELLPSPFFHYFVFEALKKIGHCRPVIECIRRRWGEWISQGLATTPEMWEWSAARGSLSQCHAWSAHPIVHFAEILLGITQLEPAWRKVRFDPNVQPGEKFLGAIPTPYGPIRVELDHTSDQLHTSVQAPPEVSIEPACTL